jgi:hypothetical protein
VADPAMGYFNLHLVRPELSRIVGERLQSSLGGRRSVTFDLMHGRGDAEFPRPDARLKTTRQFT